MKKRTVLQTRLSSLNGCSIETNTSPSFFDKALKGLGVSDKSMKKKKPKSNTKKLEEA